jgi:hypothetical protein
MRMNLEDWDSKVRPHLNYIRAGAEMAARHARALPLRPDFQSMAEIGLAETKAVLVAALAEIEAAERAYAATPMETARAA